MQGRLLGGRKVGDVVGRVGDKNVRSFVNGRFSVRNYETDLGSFRNCATGSEGDIM